MKKAKKIKKQPADSDMLGLGTLLGRRQAFGLIAARCSAADAASLREIREQKSYRFLAKGWVEFCDRHLGMSHTHANRIIGYLEEFGPAYFELAQFTGISPATYRTIAPAIQDHAVHHDGQVIALLPENTERLSHAVEQLRRAAAAQSAPGPPADRIAGLEHRLLQLTAQISELTGTTPPGEMRMRLGSVLIAARDRLERLVLAFGTLA
jgi:hypothetical protein